MPSKRDYYEVLGVERSSSVEEIEKAYRRLARQHHPDRNIGDDEAGHKFKEITEAHEILVHVEKRERYDRYGHAGLDPQDTGFGPGGSNFSDVVSDLFSAFMGGGGQSRRRGGGGNGPRRGGDRRQILDMQLHEVISEVRKSVSVNRLEPCTECSGKGTKNGKRMTCVQCQGRGEFIQRQGFFELRQTCPRCQGEGTVIADPCEKCKGSGNIEATQTVEVRVPAGADTGLRLVVPGEGDAGSPGGERGDLELVVRIAKHEDFERDGIHIESAIPVSFSQAALGATIEVPTLTGKTKLTVPRGARSHTKLRIAGEGLPELRVDRRGQPVSSSHRGELRVLIVVETPQTLTPRHEELLREMAALDQHQVAEPRKSFLDRVKGWFGSRDERK